MGRGGDAGDVVGRPLTDSAEPVGRDGFGTGVRVSGGKAAGARRGADGAGFALPRDADRRSAFQAVPAFLLGGLCAISLRFAQRCRTGGRRSKPSPRFFLGGCTRFRCALRSGADRRSAFQAVPALVLGGLCAVSLRFAQRCRPEVGVPSRPARCFCASRSGADLGVPSRPRLFLGRLYAVSLRFAQRCRPEVGVPSRPRACSWWAVRGFAALRAAVPTGGRRSKPSPRFFLVGCARFRCASRSGADRRSAFQAVPALFAWWAVRDFAALRAAVPTGGRRSQPSPRFFLVGCARFRCASRSGADRRSAFPAVPAFFLGGLCAISLRFAPRCRPEVGVPVPAGRCRPGGWRSGE